MSEHLINAWEELKRADHLIYVSLKYTRTADVIKSVIERLVNAFDFLIDAILTKAEGNKTLSAIPNSPLQKAQAVMDLFPDDKILQQFMEFYLLLRKIMRTEFRAAREFRRHVTMTVHVDGKDIDVTIDIIYEYNEKSREFFHYVRERKYV